jgi:hypothetical protein
MNHHPIRELVVRFESFRPVLAEIVPGRADHPLPIGLVGLVELVGRGFVDFDYMMGMDDGVSEVNRE